MLLDFAHLIVILDSLALNIFNKKESALIHFLFKDINQNLRLLKYLAQTFLNGELFVIAILS